jgi:hypothetical protein
MSTRNTFDKNIDYLNDYDFKNWINEYCEWYSNNVEFCYIYKMNNRKYYTCDDLYSDYLKIYRSNYEFIKKIRSN